MKYIVQISRWIVGVIFIISGFVKAVDPIGFGYKLEEYFAPDVFDIAFLHDLALPMATFFSIFEIILGVLLLLGIFRKFTVWSILLLIIFFTFLTFYSAYFNKVTDCGCFGDAMKLEPWESFWKDIFLLILSVILFIGQKHIQPLIHNNKINYAITAIALLTMGWISMVGISKLPLIDFRAYAIGKSIPEGMKSAEDLGLKPPQYTVFYTMENKQTNEKVKITDKEYLNDPKWYEEGTPWEIITDLIETKKVANGYEPPILNFYLDCDEGDQTDFYLSQPKAVFFVMPFAERITKDEEDQLNALYQKLTAQNIAVVALSNSDLNHAVFPVCYVDQITLKTIIRSNPGIVVLEKGKVINKFHNNPLPTAEEVLNSFQ